MTHRLVDLDVVSVRSSASLSSCREPARRPRLSCAGEGRRRRAADRRRSRAARAAATAPVRAWRRGPAPRSRRSWRAGSRLTQRFMCVMKRPPLTASTTSAARQPAMRHTSSGVGGSRRSRSPRSTSSARRHTPARAAGAGPSGRSHRASAGSASRRRRRGPVPSPHRRAQDLRRPVRATLDRPGGGWAGGVAGSAGSRESTGTRGPMSQARSMPIESSAHQDALS